MQNVCQTLALPQATMTTGRTVRPQERTVPQPAVSGERRGQSERSRGCITRAAARCLEGQLASSMQLHFYFYSAFFNLDQCHNVSGVWLDRKHLKIKSVSRRRWPAPVCRPGETRAASCCCGQSVLRRCGRHGAAQLVAIAFQFHVCAHRAAQNRRVQRTAVNFSRAAFQGPRALHCADTVQGRRRAARVK